MTNTTHANGLPVNRTTVIRKGKGGAVMGKTITETFKHRTIVTETDKHGVVTSGSITIGETPAADRAKEEQLFGTEYALKSRGYEYRGEGVWVLPPTTQDIVDHAVKRLSMMIGFCSTATVFLVGVLLAVHP